MEMTDLKKFQGERYWDNGVQNRSQTIDGTSGCSETLQTPSCICGILSTPSHSTQEVPVDISGGSTDPLCGHDANSALPCNSPYWQAANFENPLEPNTTSGVSFEHSYEASHAPPPQTQQSFRTPSFYPQLQQESPQINVGLTKVPQSAAFVPSVGLQDHMRASSKQLSIFGRCNSAFVSTVEEWDQRHRMHELGSSVATGRAQVEDTCPNSSSEQRPHRVNCLEKQYPRGRYIDSVNASARGPYTCTSGCGVNFARKKDWRRHEDNNYPREKYLCTCCPQTFARGYTLVSHMKTMHKKTDFTLSRDNIQGLPDDYNRQCPVCKSRFPKLEDFYDHVVQLDHFKRMATNTSAMIQSHGSHVTRDTSLTNEVIGFGHSNTINFGDSFLGPC